MATDSHVHRGVVHGKMIELNDETGLPDGQEVNVTVEPVQAREQLQLPGEGLRHAFGAWADDAEDLDEFLKEIRRSRQRPRREIEP